MNDKKDFERQSFNWLVVGAQKTGKTTTALQLAASIQFHAMCSKKVKRVLVFDPMYHELFEKDGIEKSVSYLAEGWKIPSYSVLSVSEIHTFLAQSDEYAWGIVRERGARVQDFCKEILTIKNLVTIIDDVGSRITGNVRNYPDFIDMLAFNRINSNDIFLMYHQYKLVPPMFWQYFQRAIVKQTDETKFSDDIFPKDLFVKAQKEVEEENKMTAKTPFDLRLAFRVIFPQQRLMLKESNGKLVCKIANKTYYFDQIDNDLKLLK